MTKAVPGGDVPAGSFAVGNVSVGDVRTFDSADDVARAAAQGAVETLGNAIEAYGAATWVLAGGSSPMLAYRRLVSRHEADVDWSKVRVLIGDERLVPHAHPDSNWGQIVPMLSGTAATARLVRLVPQTHLPPSEAALDYERQLRRLPTDEQGRPRLDLVWLGVGEDGHTLSLFPGQIERVDHLDDLVAPVTDSPKPPSCRITLTLRALEGASQVIVFAVGATKRSAISRAVTHGDLPIAMACATASQAGASVSWLCDAEAIDEVGLR